MNHPLVKKLLRNELLMWGLGALVVVALPMGVVVLEATTTVSSSSKPQSKGKKTAKSKSEKRSVASSSQAKVEFTEPLSFEGDSVSITDGILDPAAVFGSGPTDPSYGGTNESSGSIAESGDTLLAEVTSETAGSGILYFGGDTAESDGAGILDASEAAVVTGEASASEEAVSTLDVVREGDSASAEVVKTAGLAMEDSEEVDSDPDLIALLEAGAGNSAEKSMPGDMVKVEDAAEEKEDTRERTEVALIRPRGQVVKPVDEIIFRCRLRGKLFPYVMVRSRQKSAPWWVQGDTLRQGTYVRGRAQFGNRATIDGSRFNVVVAFVEDIEDVPEAGTQVADIPDGILLSQELEFTLRK